MTAVQIKLCLNHPTTLILQKPVLQSEYITQNKSRSKYAWYIPSTHNIKPGVQGQILMRNSSSVFLPHLISLGRDADLPVKTIDECWAERGRQKQTHIVDTAVTGWYRKNFNKSPPLSLAWGTVYTSHSCPCNGHPQHASCQSKEKQTLGCYPNLPLVWNSCLEQRQVSSVLSQHSFQLRITTMSLCREIFLIVTEVYEYTSEMFPCV